MGIKIITDNRKAFHEYAVGERFEAGLVLTGSEVKSARNGKVSLGEGWVEIDEYGEAYLREAHIGKYANAGYAGHAETRPRKLLLSRKELIKLSEATQEKGLTIVPLKMYFKEQYIKLEIGIGKGKKAYDKRESTKERDANRDMARALRQRNR